MPDEIEVVVQLPSGEAVLAGRLWTRRRRGAESASFTYDPGYIASPAAYALDPAMDLSLGQFQTAPGRSLFGALADSAPDRWGRRLIARGEQRLAEAGGRTPRSFGEADYLLGVRDDLRQGAIRFRRPGTVEYLADDHTGVPALVDLPALLSAAERLDRDEASDADLAALLRGGSSLGGARPKAHVHDGHGALAIAKFPSPANDDWDVMRWEAVALELAARAGIDVPAARLEAIDGKAVLIVRRFDRDDDRRLGYVSAMTMLEAADGDQRSYTEIAAIIEEQSPDPSDDLHQLWRRIAFNILISNTDDHLRNHGFVRRQGEGWSLAPAFDLNPDPRRGPFSTTIDLGTSAASSIALLMNHSDQFGLAPHAARDVLAEVVASTAEWRHAAAKLGLDERAMRQMATAFEHEQAEDARRLVSTT